VGKTTLHQELFAVAYDAVMSANEIIAELSKLKRSELEAVGAKLHELLGPKGRSDSQAVPGWGRSLAKFAGAVEGLPEDYALNHDHYLHGAQKR
jgi:hypothetical protein